MQASMQQRQLFTRAVSVYLEQLLHAVFCWREEVESCPRPGGFPISEEMAEQIGKLITYLQGTIFATGSVEVLCGRLAVIDRLMESAVWAMESGTSGHVNMYKHSVSYLTLAVSNESRNKNRLLASDWLLAS
jgi:hypothetical protein